MKNSRKIEIIDLIIEELVKSRKSNEDYSSRYSGICGVIQDRLSPTERISFKDFLLENRPKPDNKWSEFFIEGRKTTAWWFPVHTVDHRVKFLQALKESLSPAKTLQGVGFAGNPFSTGSVPQPRPTNPDDYGKTLIDEYGRSYLQTKEGRIY